MKLLFLAFLVGPLAAADEMPSGYFHGTMSGFDGTPTVGTLRAKAANGAVLTCGFDAKTYIELEKQRVKMDKLREGDPLEVLAYRRPGQTVCYILSMEVLPPPKVVRPNRRVDVTPAKPLRPAIVRHGSKNVAGVVIQVGPSSITLRTGTGPETFLLRRDTRYFGNGLRMDQADVNVNQRLSVEAARNVDGQWEALQLTWGDLSVH
jgi:hypothetical protein